MSYPHVIRLRGPWELMAAGQPGSTVQLVQVPSSWQTSLGADFVGRARYTRYFNMPTGLEQQERVWLCCAGVTSRGSVSLNGQRLSEIVDQQPWECDITQSLAPRNELAIEVEADAPGGGLTGEVRLEIRRAERR